MRLILGEVSKTSDTLIETLNEAENIDMTDIDAPSAHVTISRFDYRPLSGSPATQGWRDNMLFGTHGKAIHAIVAIVALCRAHPQKRA